MIENIILYNQEDNIEIFKKYSPYKFTKKTYELLDGDYFNPPFFKVIIVHEAYKISEIDIKILYNCVLINGLFIIPKKKYELFKNLNIETEKYDEYMIIRRKDNFVYSLYKRVIDCIICGVQKGSTTAALKNLSKHSDINAYPEEIHFFDIEWNKGIDFYKKHFDYSKKITMEKTPDLIYLNHTFPLIQSINPFVKLIILLRNPIDRAYSHWNMNKMNKWINLSFEEAIQEEIDYRLKENKTFYVAAYHYLQRGLYYRQIKKLLKYFPMQNIIIIISEHLKENMKDDYNKIYKFLGLPENNNIEYTFERVGSYTDKIKEETYNKLKKLFMKDVRRLEGLLGYKTKWF